MTTKGIVEKIEGDVVFVYLMEDGTCVSCQARGEGDVKGCAACGLFANNKKHPIRALIKQGIRVSEGDMVELSMSPGKAVLSGILIFLFPLVFFFLGFILAGIVLHAMNDLYKAVAGFACMAVWYLLLFLFGKIRKRQDWPVVERKINSDGALQSKEASCLPS